MRLIVPGLLCALALLLSGCFAMEAQRFYATPERSPEYYDLQKAVESALDGGSYSAPVSGNNRQAIQRVDLDADGVEEILVFSRVEQDKPLRLQVLKKTGESGYVLLCTLKGDGSGFDSVQYAQVDDRPGMEVLVSRRVADQVQPFLSVYTLSEDSLSELLSTGCTAWSLADLDTDGQSDLLLLQAASEGGNPFAELYQWQSGQLQRQGEAALSAGTDTVKRILTGQLSDETPAVFVASAYGTSELITDVFVDHEGLRNITLNTESGKSIRTVRNYYVYSTDIDGDGAVELPNTLALDPIAGDPASEGQYRIVWSGLRRDGETTERMNTYHSFDAGWYFILPEDWVEQLGATAVEIREGSAVRFVRHDALRDVELMTIYSFSGDNAAALAQAEDRVVLARRGGTWFSAHLAPGLSMDSEELKTRFRFIAAELLPDID